MTGQYSWIDIYQELATSLLTWQNKLNYLKKFYRLPLFLFFQPMRIEFVAGTTRPGYKIDALCGSRPVLPL
jgi:hypothetical protein